MCVLHLFYESIVIVNCRFRNGVSLHAGICRVTQAIEKKIIQMGLGYGSEIFPRP